MSDFQQRQPGSQQATPTKMVFLNTTTKMVFLNTTNISERHELWSMQHWSPWLPPGRLPTLKHMDGNSTTAVSTALPITCCDSWPVYALLTSISQCQSHSPEPGGLKFLVAFHTLQGHIATSWQIPHTCACSNLSEKQGRNTGLVVWLP
jgi:hypothetical protein